MSDQCPEDLPSSSQCISTPAPIAFRIFDYPTLPALSEPDLGHSFRSLDYQKDFSWHRPFNSLSWQIFGLLFNYLLSTWNSYSGGGICACPVSPVPYVLGTSSNSQLWWIKMTPDIAHISPGDTGKHSSLTVNQWWNTEMLCTFLKKQ